MTLKAHLASKSLDVAAIKKHLDALSSAERIAQTRALNGEEQARLFEAAKGVRPLTLSELVPASVPSMTGVPHEGRNSLPAFTLFAKVFYRPDDGSEATTLWGYNRNPFIVQTTVGPGYYVAYDHGGGEVLVDYLRQPPRPLPSGPAILSNKARLSRFVYNGTQDVLRAVSSHVSIGRASRLGKPLDNWFILCRDFD